MKIAPFIILDKYKIRVRKNPLCIIHSPVLVRPARTTDTLTIMVIINFNFPCPVQFMLCRRHRHRHRRSSLLSSLKFWSYQIFDHVSCNTPTHPCTICVVKFICEQWWVQVCTTKTHKGNRRSCVKWAAMVISTHLYPVICCCHILINTLSIVVVQHRMSISSVSCWNFFNCESRD